MLVEIFKIERDLEPHLLQFVEDPMFKEIGSS